MMVTLVATCGVSAILAGVLVALGMIERHLATSGRQALVATGLNWPVRPQLSCSVDASFADRHGSQRMRQIIAGSGAIPHLTNRWINGH